MPVKPAVQWKEEKKNSLFSAFLVITSTPDLVFMLQGESVVILEKNVFSRLSLIAAEETTTIL